MQMGNDFGLVDDDVKTGDDAPARAYETKPIRALEFEEHEPWGGFERRNHPVVLALQSPLRLGAHFEHDAPRHDRRAADVGKAA